MARSPGFGSNDADLSPISDSVSLRLPYSVKLANTINSLTHYTKGTQSPAYAGFHCLLAHGFRFYFTPLTGVLFAFPSRYWYAIGRKQIFSLGRWSSRLPTGLHVSRGTRELLPGRACHFAYGTITLFGCPFQGPSAIAHFGNFPGCNLKQPRNPSLIAKTGLGCSLFARRYWGNLWLISVPAGTEMFHFPALASPRLWIQHGTTLD